MDAAEYDELAARTILDMADAEAALVWSEIEAKAADRQWESAPRPIDPHHLTNGRRLLEEGGVLLSSSEQTRGGQTVEVFYRPDTAQRRVEPAGARKRLLQARFLGWATGTQRHPLGLIGTAGERVVQASLLAAAPAGYRVEPRDGRGVTQFLGDKVVGGPLDAAAHLMAFEGGTAQGIVAVPIEVKNIRDWIYPAAAELYQLLYKAARLQVDHPQQMVAPVLVCRRAQKLTFRMAKTLGFYVIDARRQFILPSPDVEPDKLEEVRSELGYLDLISLDGPLDYIVRHFQTHFPAVALRAATRWSVTGPVLIDQFQSLRAPSFPDARRQQLDQLKATAAEHMDDLGGWWGPRQV